ncbi:MAG: aminopeptidase P N-terminal domain-containing protein [Verrucomicrobiaceae bacterium]|nr:aminopeptidase P N-terminal domain-containing protein [Verrucomicrobiaceae bacterium]
MRYKPLPASFYTENRQRLYAKLAPRSVVIVHSNDVLPTNADGSMSFIQNTDMLYLSGIDQEESILILFPDASDPKQREMIFTRETNETVAVWEGEKLTKEQARQQSGIARAHWLDDFETQFRSVMCQADHVYLNSNEHIRATIPTETRQTRFTHRCRQEYPLHDFRRLAPLMHDLRAIKSPHEITALNEAIRITGDGFERLLRFVKPGVHEFEIEAELTHEFLRQRARGFAYTPIIATGANACVLHYITNHCQCQDGELILLDVAANYANYNADLTRTIPVNGRFTPRQRLVYDAVLRVFKKCCTMLRPGVIIREYQEQVGLLMQDELLGLGLITQDDIAKQDPEKPAYKKYFPHGTSHPLGLDVHDVGRMWQPIQPGMVFTVEPGIYIREEKLGVRLENNILIGENGNTDLMAHIPIEADDIEAAMNAGK